MKNKIFALLLALALCVGTLLLFASCGGDKDPKDNEKTTEDEKKEEEKKEEEKKEEEKKEEEKKEEEKKEEQKKNENDNVVKISDLFPA